MALVMILSVLSVCASAAAPEAGPVINVTVPADFEGELNGRLLFVLDNNMPGEGGQVFDEIDVTGCPVFGKTVFGLHAGDVSQVMDLAYRGQLSVSGVYELPLSQSLLALPGTDITDIREVQSHPQALSQCMPYLKEHGWILTQAVNTAVAAKNVAESGRHDLAVVASEEAAKLYGLRVLSSSINESKNNTTRFLVFSAAECKVKPTDNHFILFFNVKNEPGSLGRAVSLIGQYHFNLRNLKSFPTGQENWSYYFYTEGEGNLSTPKGQLMMEELKSVCSRVKILGSFPDVKTI